MKPVKEENLEVGKRYHYKENEENETGTFVKEYKDAIFFKPDLPTTYIVDTKEGADQGRCYPDTIGLVGFVKTGADIFYEVE